MIVKRIATQRVDCDEPLLAILGQAGHDYYAKTVNTDDGTITEYYRGRNRERAELEYTGMIARLEIMD